MANSGRQIESLIRLCDKIAFCLISFMMLTVVIGVLSRLLFDLTGGEINLVLPGTIELVSYAMLLMVFTSMPRALLNGPVKVEILVAKLPTPINRFLARLWNLLLASVFAIIAYLLGKNSLSMLDRGDVTQDLGVPMYLIYGASALCCITIVIVCFWLTLFPHTNHTENEK